MSAPAATTSPPARTCWRAFGAIDIELSALSVDQAEHVLRALTQPE
ncbi:hypothetical protein [Streptomyces sp. NPDC096153]